MRPDARSPVTGESYDPLLRPRYTEIPTLLRAPAAGALAGLDVGLVGVPFDGAVSNRPGARLGPRALRDASSLTRALHPVSGRDPFAELSVADLGDVLLADVFDLAAVGEALAGYYGRLRNAGVRPLTAGGDHSISFPILRALGAGQPLALVQIDAHTDTWGEFMGSRLHHGGPFRLAAETGVIDPRHSAQVGIRGAQNSDEGWVFSRDAGFRVWPMDAVEDAGLPAIIADVRMVVGDLPVYITFDIDSLDPAFAPGTGTPEIGGFSTREALRLLRGLEGLNIVGADLVEVAPPLDHAGITATAGATLLYELLCLMAAAPGR